MNNKLTKETHMNNNLPDLSTWHLVPVGGTIPKNTPYAHDHGNSLTVVMDGYHRDMKAYGGDSIHYYTEHPVPPPLPTEEGAMILVTDDEHPPRILLTLEAGQWVSSLGLWWNVGELRAWCPVTVGEMVVTR